MVKDTKVREATGVASMLPREVRRRFPMIKKVNQSLQTL